MIQTALVLSHSIHTSNNSNKNYNNHRDGMNPRLDMYHIRWDGRLRPAYYLMTVGLVSMATLTLWAPYCRSRREELQQREHDQQIKETLALLPESRQSSIAV
jgi:hypothetical protein